MNARTLVVAALFAACGGPNVPGPLPTTNTQPLNGCGGKSIVAIDGVNLTRFGADGSVTPIFHFGAELPADLVAISDWQELNGFMAVEALLSTPDGSAIDRYEFVVINPKDQVVFHTFREQ